MRPVAKTPRFSATPATSVMFSAAIRTPAALTQPSLAMITTLAPSMIAMKSLDALTSRTHAMTATLAQ
jgi:hypothetical protein